MSDDSNSQEAIEDSVQVEEQTIPVGVYEVTKTDMLKYKSENKGLKEQLAQIAADREAEKNAQLLENKQYEALYKKAEEKLKTVLQERESERSQFIDGHKINAVTQALGGFKKPEYTKFINRDAISVREDGSVDHDSVEAEVARIKKEYVELIKTAQANSLPNQAPSGIQPKELKDLSEDERNQLRRNILTKN